MNKGQGKKEEALQRIFCLEKAIEIFKIDQSKPVLTLSKEIEKYLATGEVGNQLS